MNTISFPLTLNMVRPQVADLQEGLALLGYSIDEEERAKQRYGKSTRAAVLAFQTQQRLSANGEVNRSTAQRLNQLLAQQGASVEAASTSGIETPGIDPQPIPVGREVLGTVRHQDGTPIQDMLVRAFNRRVGGEDMLGEVQTRDLGRYAITYPFPAGVSAVDVFVRAYDDEGEIVAVSPITIDAGIQERLDVSVDDPRFRGPAEFARTSAALNAVFLSAVQGRSPGPSDHRRCRVPWAVDETQGRHTHPRGAALASTR